MSKQVDERVVSMQFDNKNFESNVKTTMSTLDKLKEKLKSTESTKGLENLGTAANKVNLSSIGSSIDKISSKFSNLGIIGTTALINITNSAINAGKRLLAAFAIDPIKSGFQEYELKMGSIQTIMASTGESLETVNKYLNELNEYSDKTIYSFQDMTSNIGKFTNAGVKLEDAVAAIQGVSNEAAISGANANEASRAMYNFAQALSAGYVKLIDWKSIENANMATVDFKNQLIETALSLGTVTKSADGMYQTLNGNAFNATKNFNEVLTDQWMTSEVLITTLKKYSDETTDIGKKATSAATEVKTFSMMMDTLKESAQSGWAQTWELIVGDFEESKSLFTRLSEFFGGIIDKTSKIRNDFVGKVLNSPWEKLVKKVNAAGVSTEDFLDKISVVAKENGIAVDDLIKKYGSLKNAIKAGKIPSNIFTQALKKLIGAEYDAKGATKEVTKSIENLDEIVKKVLRGDFGNGAERIKALTEAGYDYATVQNKVNETLGISVRHVSKLTEAQIENADQLVTLSDEQLKNKGYTEEQVEALRELEKAANESGSSINELVNNMGKPGGRDMLISSLSKIGELFKNIGSYAKESWANVFGESENNQSFLTTLIEKLYDLTNSLEISEKSAENFKNVFEGLFSIFKLSKGIISLSLSSGLKILSTVLDLFGYNLMDLAGWIGECITKFVNWIELHTPFVNMADKISKVLYTVVGGVKRCIDAFLELPIVTKTIEKVKNFLVKLIGTADKGFDTVGIDGFCDKIAKAFDKLESWIKSFKDVESASEIFDRIKASFSKFIDDVSLAWPFLGKLRSYFSDSSELKGWISKFKELEIVKKLIESVKNAFSSMSANTKDAYSIGKNTIEGLINGLRDGSMSIGTVIGTIIQGLIDTVKALLGIHSPSTVFFAIGGFIIAGLIGGLMSKTTNIKEALETIGSTIIEFFSGLDIETVIAAGLGIGALVMVKKSLDTLKDFASPMKGIGKIFNSVSNLVDTFADNIKMKKWAIISNAILKVASAIAILAASVIAMSFVDPKRLWSSIGALAAIGAIMAGLMGVAKLVSDTKGIDKIGSTLLKVSGAIAIMSIITKILGSMDPGKLQQGFEALTCFSLLIGILMMMTKLITESKNVDKIGGTLLKVSGAIMIMALVARILGSMDPEKLRQGIEAITCFTLIIAILMAATKLITGSKNVDKIGGTLIKIAGAIMIMVLVAKIASKMSPEELTKGTLAILAFSGIIVGLMYATKLINGSKNVDSIGRSILSIAGAILIMILVAKMASKMSPSEIKKGTLAIVAFSGIIVGLMAATKLISGSKNVGKIGTALLGVAGSIAIMLIVAKLASKMEPSEIVKGAAVVTAFGGIIVGLMAATKLISGSKNVDKIGKTILMVAGAIGIMALSVALLSLINPERLAVATVAFATIAGMFALVIAVAKKAELCIKNIIVVTVAIVAMAGVLWLLSSLPVESTLSSAAALSILLLSLSGALAILGTIKKVPWSAIGALAVLGLVVAELAIILGAISYFDIDISIGTVASISLLLLTMTGVLAALTIIGSFASSAFSGIASLAVLGLVVAELATILGVMSYFDIAPSLETAKSLSLLLIAMSGALVILGVVGLLGPAAFIGIGALATLITGIGGLIITIGALVTEFPMLETFLNTGIPILEKIGYALGSFFGNIVGGFLSGSLSGLPDIGTKLSEFMTNATPFIDGAKSIDPSVMEGVKTLAEAVLILTGANLLDGIGRFLGFGDSSLDTFGSQLGSLATNLNAFVTNLGTFTEEQVTTIDCAGRAIKALASAANEIPNEGGWLSVLFGDNSITSFGSKLPQLATDLSNFVANLGTFGEEQVTSVDCAGKAIKALAESADKIPNEGGWISKLVGDNSLSTFGSQLPQLGTDLSNFVANLGTFSEAQVATVKSAVGTINALANLSDSSTDTSNITSLGEKLETFATKIGEFLSKLSEFSSESITSATNKLKALISVINDISSSDTEAAESFANSLKSLGENGVDKFVEAFNSNTNVSKIKYAADNMIKILVSGLENKTTDVKYASEDLGKKAISAMASKTNKDDAKSSGKDLGSGLVKGIEAKYQDAYDAGFKLGKKAVQGEKDGQKSNSPSKLTILAGKWLGEGLVIGMHKMSDKVYVAGNELGKTATSTMSSAISRITDFINSDIDAQPTIRPVLDLSSVQSGVNSIGGMLSGRRTLTIDASSVGSISASMNALQNGSNTKDVVTAIKGLRNDIANMPRNTYNIDGIIYDDGTNVAEAVSSLVRAVRIERRK